jgi:dTDP-4-amino-4,6-dideoxygalactose transaminase
MQYLIPYCSSYFAGNEQKYVLDVLQSGLVSGDRKYTKLVQEYFKNQFSIPDILLTTSGSTALDMTAILLNLKAGDEVIMPSYTFVSTANAVLMRGARPVFVEIDETLNIDISKIEEKITKKTKAIYPVHYAGCSCDMDNLLVLARKYRLFVVEDAAQAVNAKYKDRYLGTLGDLGAYSFHETKNFVCGEGGALAVNNHEYLERAEIIREKGTNRSKFFKGFVDKYTWCDMGGSYLPSDLLSAVLLAQLEQKDIITEKRKVICERYRNNLTELEKKGFLSMMKIPEYNTPNYHIFYILLQDGAQRDALLAHLKSEKIGAIFHYIPLHTSKMGAKLGYKREDFPLSVNLSERIIRLPLFAGLAAEQADYICEKIITFFRR